MRESVSQILKSQDEVAMVNLCYVVMVALMVKSFILG